MPALQDSPEKCKSAEGLKNGRFESDQVIRGKPARCRSTVGAPKNRQRILSVHRSGWSRNAGPQQWYGGIRSTLGGSPMDASARSIVTPPHPPPLRRRKAPGGRGLGNLVRPVSPPGTRFPVGLVSDQGTGTRVVGPGHRNIGNSTRELTFAAKLNVNVGAAPDGEFKVCARVCPRALVREPFTTNPAHLSARTPPRDDRWGRRCGRGGESLGAP